MKRIFLAAAAVFVFNSAVLYANDIINLKNGNVVKGEIIKTNDDEIVILFEGATGQATLSYNDILYINHMEAGLIRDAYEKANTFYGILPSLRGLDFQLELEKKVLTEAGAFDVIVKDLEEEYSGEKLRGMEKTFKFFRLFPEGMNYKETYLDITRKQVAGFYHPKDNYLAIVIGGEAEKAYKRVGGALEALGIEELGYQAQVFVHEVMHALQDQNFNLTALLNEARNEDMKLALISIVEGEAYLVENEFTISAIINASKEGKLLGALKIPAGSEELFKKMITNMLYSPQFMNTDAILSNTLVERMKIFGNIPPYMKDRLIFPYVQGLVFVNEVKKAGGWKLVNKIYRDFPLSTEQLLHPDKFLVERDFPQRISLPVKDLSDVLRKYTLMYNDSMGEYNTGWILRAFHEKADSEMAAAGWDGDALLLFEDAVGKTMVIWGTTWDSEQDAKEFFDAYKALLEKKYQGLNFTTDETGLTASLPFGVAFLRKQGSDVLVVEGAKASDLTAIIKYLEKTEKKEIKRDILIHNIK